MTEWRITRLGGSVASLWDFNQESYSSLRFPSRLLLFITFRDADNIFQRLKGGRVKPKAKWH